MSTPANTLASVSHLVRGGSFDADAMRRILLEIGVKPSHVRMAMQRAHLTGEPLSTIMRDFGFLTGEQVAQAISRQTRLRHFRADEADQIDPAHLKGIKLGTFRGFVPVGLTADGGLLVAVPDAAVINDARNEFYPQATTVVVASEHLIQSLYRRYFAQTEHGFDEAIEKFSQAIGNTRRGEDEQLEAGLVRNVFIALLRHACYSEASDLYLNKSGTVGLIKLKINGVGQMFRIIEGTLYDRLLNKLVTENVKAEDLRREPREAIVSFDEETARANEDIAGRFGFRLELTESRGEREAVVRILDKQAPATNLDLLAFDARTMRTIRRISGTATGLFLITGPTGSGKTTTLYAMLKDIDPERRSVQSVENPIEYRHGLWHQHELRKDSSNEGEEHDKWLKGLLRNAPDVILVGEVRDRNVAQILLHFANTGHLAFSTLHTNNAAMALARLKALDIDMNTLASVLLGILAQRLIRVLCPRCKKPDSDEETLAALKVEYLAAVGHAPRRAGEGCDYCGHTGYRRRRMVYELLEVNHSIQELIETNAAPSVIARQGIPADRTMWASGLRLVAEGITSFEELRQHVNPDI
jgi:type II secretory ATPase GspE/PulE/Tfp pilus assembly ATPase PilB-like protein